MEHPPDKSTFREVAEGTIVGAAGMVPVIGSPLAVALTMAMGWAFQRRTKEWLDDLADAVSELQDRDGLTIEELQDNELFVDAVVNATRAAQATHQADKLAALRNGVLNSIADDAPSADEQARFFRLVDEFTPSHLHLLSHLNDPGASLDAAGVPRPDIYMGGRSALLEALPEFTNRREWYDLLTGDLQDARLLSTNGLHTTQSGASLWESATSALGKRFLAFVSSPPTAS